MLKRHGLVSASLDPRQNQLLATLPRAELQRSLPDLEFVDMQLGDVLYGSGGTLEHVYFPLTAIVSLLHYCQMAPPRKSPSLAMRGF